MLRKKIAFLTALLLISLVAQGQERTVENRPYVDLRQFHFGVDVGTHLQDVELLNVGPQMVERLISCDQDRWDSGFNVGVLGEFRLSTHFQFRIAPTMYFGTRHLTFLNHSEVDINGKPTEERQQLKTAYISCALDMIFAAPRFNNHRPYIVTGLNPMINLSGRDNDFIKLKRYDLYAELGIGCDYYLPFFKLRPELKFMYSLTNSLDTDHANHLKNRNMIQYTNSVSQARTKIIALTFYFE